MVTEFGKLIYDIMSNYNLDINDKNFLIGFDVDKQYNYEYNNIDDLDYRIKVLEIALRNEIMYSLNLYNDNFGTTNSISEKQITHGFNMAIRQAKEKLEKQENS